MHFRKLIDELFPDTSESGRWMRCLVELGGLVSTQDISRPITVAVCLPRVEFAGVLVAVGACLRASFNPSPDWRTNWMDWAGKRIAFSLAENPYVYWGGIISGSAPDSSEKLIIQTNSGRGWPWSIQDLYSVKPDPENDGQPLGDHDQAKKAFRDERSDRLKRLLIQCAFKDETCDKLKAFLANKVVGELYSSWHLITLVGVKNRILEEFNGTLPCATNGPTAGQFADLLRPEGLVEDSAILQLVSARDLTTESTWPLVLIEGSRRLSENLRATEKKHRIILLGRNEPNYPDSVDIINNQFQQRTADFSLPDFSFPEQIKLRMFHH